MQDLWDELYGRRGRYGEGWTIPEVWDHEPKGPDKHGYRYYLYFGCQCDVCVEGCLKHQDRKRKPDAAAA